MVGSVAGVAAWPGFQMFSVKGGGSAYLGLSARGAASKARELRRSGLNDVEIFRSDETRISLYALDQIVRSEA